MATPSPPKIRLGPTFATANDVDRDVEEALGLDPEPPAEAMEVDPAPTLPEKGVDEEIDELLSDNDEADPSGQIEEEKGNEGGHWKCRWDNCFVNQEKQDILVEHVQNEHIGQGKEAYICLWEHCPRKGQKQATRHSLITHCRAHTGERPYTCGEPDCGKTFTRSDALTKHLRSLHGITPELPPGKKRKDPIFGSVTLGGTSATGSSPPPQSRVSHSPTASMGTHHPITKRSEVDDVIAEVLPLSPPPPPEVTTIIHPPPATEATATSTSTQKHAHVRSNTEGGKPKAKPRKSRAKTQKDKDAAAAAGPIASGSTSTLPSRIRNPASRLPPSSAFAQEGIEDMAVDVDLAAELPRLCARTAFWVESDDDEPALDLVREYRARERASPPYRAGEEDYDSLDEEMPPIHPERVVAETTHPDDNCVILPVLSRSNWQARYMMGKAKVMLLSEENDMRRRELMAALEEEADLDEKLAKTIKADAPKARTFTSTF